MRVLFLDKEDSTLFVAEVKDAMYYPDESCLSFVSADNDDIDIYDIPYSLAEPIIRELFEKGRADLSTYKASLNGRPEDTPDESDVRYEFDCTCGEHIEMSEDVFARGSMVCPRCGEYLEFELEDADEASPSPAPKSNATQMRGPEVERKLFRGLFGRKKD